MTTACPNGHESTWPDWCSVCGERLGPVEEADADAAAPLSPAPASATPGAARPPTPNGPTCDNCGVPRHEHDVFCENCGYDFASGSLPEGTIPDATQAAPAPQAIPMHAKVVIDADFFATSVGDVDLSLPDSLPEQQMVPLLGIRILIGRKSTSRGIFPEIDVRSLTEDPAVSSRHAMLERDVDSNWKLTDLGSTNGTFLTSDTAQPIEAGVAVSVAAGTSIYLGAWTRIDLAETVV